MKHYWFLAWPDHKAPVSTAKQLIELSQEVASERQKRIANANGTTVGPTLVHCRYGNKLVPAVLVLYFLVRQLIKLYFISIVRVSDELDASLEQV